MAGFWARFARLEARVGDDWRLENRQLPILEVNATYSAAWTGQPILVCPASFESSQLEGNGYDFMATLVALEFEAAPIPSSVWVEQVAWTQASSLAAVWCDGVGAGDWHALVTLELARTLERDANLLAYLAYEGDEATGMMIVSNVGICGLWAGTDDVLHALFARGASDVGRFEVSVDLERSSAFPDALETARFEVWIKSVTGNSDRPLLAESPRP